MRNFHQNYIFYTKKPFIQNAKGNKELSGPKMLLITYLKIFRQEKNYIKDF